MQPITIILTQGYSDWEIAPLAGTGRAFYGVEIHYASPDGGPLTSVGGLPVADTAKFVAPEGGVVVLCGGPVWEAADAPDIKGVLKESLDRGCVVAAICGGTAALARAGLLDTVRHTSNGPGYLDKLAAGYQGQQLYVDQPAALRDGAIITAAAAAPASFAQLVLEAAGIPAAEASQVCTMLAQEHVGQGA